MRSDKLPDFIVETSCWEGKPRKMSSNKLSDRVGIALIGLGRAGSIHFNNCLGNRRIDLRYLVDYDVGKCQTLIDVSYLDTTKALSPDQLMTALGKKLV